MKKSETVALYKDAYLLGKDEEAIKNFSEKELDKQYIAIMNWKRKQKNQNLAGQPTVKDVIAHIKNAHKALQGMVAMSPKDEEKIKEAVNTFSSAISDYEKTKKQQLLKQLESEKMKLESKGEDLNRKIEALRQELG